MAGCLNLKEVNFHQQFSKKNFSQNPLISVMPTFFFLKLNVHILLIN